MYLLYQLYICVTLFFVTARSDDLKLLVIGGEYRLYGYKGILQDVELLDPFNKNSNCTKPPDLPFPRKCMVSEYFNGRPFIIGGGSRGIKYDTSLALVNNTWIDTPVRLNHTRYCAISAQPKPKTMWVLGGDSSGKTNGMTAEILHSNANKNKNVNASKTGFRDTGNAPMDIRWSSNDRKCVALINETHHFLVGYNNNASYIVETSKEPYSFKPLPQMKFGSHIGGACVTIKDSLNRTRLFVVGGGNIQLGEINLDLMVKTEFFDFVTNKWIEGPNLPRIFYMGGYVKYPDDRGFVLIGGQDMTNFGKSGYKPKYYSDMLRYNKSMNSFEYLPKHLSVARSRFGAMLVPTVNSNCTIVLKTISSANAHLPENLNKHILWHIAIIIVIFLLDI